MRFIISLIWALLIGAALAYVLASMGDDVFNISQAVTFTGAIFIGIILIDGILSALQKQSE